MEKYSMFLGRKNQYCENDYTMLPGKGGWSWSSQSWLEVNYLGRLVHRYGRRQWHPTPGKSQGWRIDEIWEHFKQKTSMQMSRSSLAESCKYFVNQRIGSWVIGSFSLSSNEHLLRNLSSSILLESWGAVSSLAESLSTKEAWNSLRQHEYTISTSQAV